MMRGVGRNMAFRVFLIGVALTLCVSEAHAGLFGPSNYQECIDDVVKNAKFKEALRSGESNCYEKFIRPVQDKMESNADRVQYRKATQNEIQDLRCKKVGWKGNYLIECRMQSSPMSKYFKLKVQAKLSNGSIKILEMRNYAPDAKWSNGEFIELGEGVDEILYGTLEVKDIK